MIRARRLASLLGAVAPARAAPARATPLRARAAAAGLATPRRGLAAFRASPPARKDDPKAADEAGKDAKPAEEGSAGQAGAAAPEGDKKGQEEEAAAAAERGEAKEDGEAAKEDGEAAKEDGEAAKEDGEEAKKDGEKKKAGGEEEDADSFEAKMDAFFLRFMSHNPLKSDAVRLVGGLALMWFGASLAYETYLEAQGEDALDGIFGDPDDLFGGGGYDEAEDEGEGAAVVSPIAYTEDASLPDDFEPPSAFDRTINAMASPLLSKTTEDGDPIVPSMLDPYVIFMGRLYKIQYVRDLFEARRVCLPSFFSLRDRKLAHRRARKKAQAGEAAKQAAAAMAAQDMMGQPRSEAAEEEEKSLPVFAVSNKPGDDTRPVVYEDYVKNMASKDCEVCDPEVFARAKQAAAAQELPPPRLRVGPAGDTFCLSHTKDPRCSPCYSCNRLACGETELNMGQRGLCTTCSADSVVWGDELGPLTSRVLAFFETSGLPLPSRKASPRGARLPEFRVCLTDFLETPDAMRIMARKQQGRPEMGRHSESWTVTSLYERKTGFMGVYGPRAEVAGVHEIKLLRGLSYLHTGKLLVHEMMHAWMHLNNIRLADEWLTEGICDHMAYMWLSLQLNCPKRAHEAALMLRQMEEVKTDPRGWGQAAVRQAMKGRSLEEVLSFVKGELALPHPVLEPGPTRLFAPEPVSGRKVSMCPDKLRDGWTPNGWASDVAAAAAAAAEGAEGAPRT